MVTVIIECDGLNLVGTREESFDEIYNMVIIFRGLTANRSAPLLREVTDELRDENTASVHFNFSGHGNSDGKFENITVLNEVGDINVILDYVKTDPHICNIYLVEHSQGDVVALMLAELYPGVIKKAVLLAPAATLKTDVPNGSTQGVKYNPDHIPGRLPFKDLTLNGFYLRIVQRLPVYEVSVHFTRPVCLIRSANDTVIFSDASKKYDQVYENSTLYLVEGADRSSTDTYQETTVDLAVEFLQDDNIF